MNRSFVSSVLVVAALVLTGCSAAAISTSEDVGMKTGSVGYEAADVSQGESVYGAVILPDQVTQGESDRQVITTGYVSVSVEDPVASVAKAIQIAESAGGRVDARTEYAPANGDQGSASLSLRLPSATLTATIDKLTTLGTVESISLSAQDVTTAVQDLDARITALRASLDRLLALMAKAATTESLIALETAVSDRQGNLESLEAQQRYLADQVALSTIELSLISPADAPADVPQNFWSGIVVGWNSIVSAMTGLLVVAGVVLPWLLFAGLIGGAAVLVVRWNKRRHGAEAEARSVGSSPVAAEPLESEKKRPRKP